MKILFIPYGTDLAPATRYRVAQYLPYLREKSFDCRVYSAISRFSTSLMIRSPDFIPPARLLYYLYVLMERPFRFLYLVAIAKRFDVMFLQRTTFPFGLERLLKAVNPNIVFDIDDAIYIPDKEGYDVVTRMKKYIKENEVVGILKASKAIIVENDHIKNFVSRYCKDILKIPGPIDTARFSVKAKRGTEGVVIGWIGSPATTGYLNMLDDVLTEISKKYAFVRFRFIGLGRYENPGIKVERIKWDYDSEVSELQGFDIGIMPMPNDEWTRGKLGCKMLQYMAVGIPAVISYTPTNAEIVKNGVNGFFANNDEEWLKVLSSLIEDRSLRKRIGEKGRETILEKCSLSQNIDRLIGIFKRVFNLYG